MLEQNDSDLSNNQHTDPSSINKPIKQHIIIVGAGFSGIGAAIKLKEKGVLKRIGPDKGGYWKVLVKLSETDKKNERT